MNGCPAHGNRIQLNPPERSTRMARPLKQIVVGQTDSRAALVTFLRVLERHSVGPFPAQGLDEPLGFAIGARGVGPGADVFEAQGPPGLGKAA
jgi:hypothetical protein